MSPCTNSHERDTHKVFDLYTHLPFTTLRLPAHRTVIHSGTGIVPLTMATGLDELCKAISASTEGHDALPRHSIHPTWGFQNDGLSVGSSSSHLPPSVPPSSGPSRRRMPSLRRSTPGIPSLIPSAPPAPRRTGQKRDWRPLGALPSMAMVEERTGSRAAQVRRNSGSAERELSHCE